MTHGILHTICVNSWAYSDLDVFKTCINNEEMICRILSFLIGDKSFVTKCQPELPSVSYNFECLKHNTSTRKIKTKIMKTFNMCLLYLFNRYLLMYLYLIRYSVLHVLVKGDSKINLACLILFRNKNFIFVWQVSCV